MAVKKKAKAKVKAKAKAKPKREKIDKETGEITEDTSLWGCVKDKATDASSFLCENALEIGVLAVLLFVVDIDADIDTLVDQ